MKTFFVCCLVLTCALGSYYDESFFLGLKDTPFGQTILQTVQLELGNSSPERILNLLQQMKTDLAAEQQEEDTLIATRNEDCTTRLSDVEASKAISEGKRADDERQVPQMTEERGDKQRQVADKVVQRQRNSDRIQLLNGERQATRSAYEVRRDELVGLVATLQEAKGLVSQLKSGSFIQIKDSLFLDMKNHQDKFIKHYPNQRGFHSLVKVMLEVMQDSGLGKSADAAGRVVVVIDNIVESIFEVQKSEMMADDTREQDYQNQSKRLEVQSRTLDGTVAMLQALVENISQRLLELDNDIATQQQMSDTKTTQQKHLQTICQDQQRGYDIQTTNRNDQTSIISQCIEIFQTRFNKDLQSYIQRLKV